MSKPHKKQDIRVIQTNPQHSNRVSEVLPKVMREFDIALLFKGKKYGLERDPRELVRLMILLMYNWQGKTWRNPNWNNLSAMSQSGVTTN